MIKKAHVWVSGRVQGVWFRSNVREKARELGLTGWVRNLWDGRVEAIFEGEEEKIKEMIEWCWRGPPLAKVRDVAVKMEESSNEFDDFVVRY
jgi:acylphosphatase